MKSTEFANKIKELTRTSNLDDALAAVEKLMEMGAPTSPFGMLIIVDPGRDGMYWAHPFGVENPLTDMQLVKMAASHIQANLEPVLDQLKEQEMRQKIKAEMAAQEKSE